MPDTRVRSTLPQNQDPANFAATPPNRLPMGDAFTPAAEMALAVAGSLNAEGPVEVASGPFVRPRSWSPRFRRTWTRSPRTRCSPTQCQCKPYGSDIDCFPHRWGQHVFGQQVRLRGRSVEHRDSLLQGPFPLSHDAILSPRRSGDRCTGSVQEPLECSVVVSDVLAFVEHAVEEPVHVVDDLAIPGAVPRRTPARGRAHRFGVVPPRCR